MLEISSFQLETIETFHPQIAVVLNITPDHLDRHHTFENYAAAKARIFENQTAGDFAVLNADDATCVAMADEDQSRRVLVQPPAGGRARSVRPRRPASSGATPSGEQTIMPVSEIALKGAHNVENVLAAVCAGMLAGVDPADIRRAVANFKAVEHRLEYVATVRGVEYYNDSKATNVDATIKALESFPGRIHLILGGKDKGSDYSVLNPICWRSASSACTPSAPLRRRSNRRSRGAEVVSAGTLDNAVRRASEVGHCRATSCCWLRPAPASISSISYEHRGRVFKDLVRQLAAREQARTRGSKHAGRQRVMAKRVSVDKWLFTVTLLLVFIGLVMVFSASAVMAKERFGSSYSFLLRQMGWAAAGLAAMVVVMNIDYKQYRRPSIVSSPFSVSPRCCWSPCSCFATRTTRIAGSSSARFSFQPSELAKPAIILYLAYFLESRWQQITDWKHVLLPGRRAQRAARAADRQGA